MMECMYLVHDGMHVLMPLDPVISRDEKTMIDDNMTIRDMISLEEIMAKDSKWFVTML